MKNTCGRLCVLSLALSSTLDTEEKKIKKKIQSSECWSNLQEQWEARVSFSSPGRSLDFPGMLGRHATSWPILQWLVCNSLAHLHCWKAALHVQGKLHCLRLAHLATDIDWPYSDTGFNMFKVFGTLDKLFDLLILRRYRMGRIRWSLTEIFGAIWELIYAKHLELFLT